MVFILYRPLKPLLKTQPYFFLSTQFFQKYLIEEFVICTLCGFGRIGVIIYYGEADVKHSAPSQHGLY